jgi:hypothetical protein
MARENVLQEQEEEVQGCGYSPFEGRKKKHLSATEGGKRKLL